MKAIINIALISVVILTLSACEKEELPDEANVTFVFEHRVDDKTLAANTPFDYINAAQNKYNVSALKYIISNVVLIDQSDNEVEFGNYDVIDGLGGDNKLNAVLLPNGNYKKMRFTLGVGPEQNFSPDPNGELDPNGDMYFNSTDGYIFLKHEGKFIDKDSVEQDLVHHYGKIGNSVDIELTVGGLTVNGISKTAYVQFNLSDLYKVPAVNFDDGPKRYSNPEDADWIAALKSNLANAFVFNGSYEDRD